MMSDLKTIDVLDNERDKLFGKYADKIEKTEEFSRKTVSFQANKLEPVYRWFKYKEGFSAILVKNLLKKYCPTGGNVLDPFAGAGTTLFASRDLGWDATGIELLPVGAFVMDVRQAIEKLDLDNFINKVATFWPLVQAIEPIKIYIQHIPITKDAFPPDTDRLLNKYIAYCHEIKEESQHKLFLFAAFSILEEISFTRKDGQYLRWDHRSSRTLKGSFDKGKIYSFEEAIKRKLNQIVDDLTKNKDTAYELLTQEIKPEMLPGKIEIIQGSCLDLLPDINADHFDFVVTSPPYCNRYDYTRTYALELVFLGYTNTEVRELRQNMLSCTVENKEKVEYLRILYSARNQDKAFEKIMQVYESIDAMTEVNNILEELKVQGKLNNKGIARMVKNYFLEMCFVIYELSRTVKSQGYIALVNDNVRYGGQEIPVDLILSEFASCFDMEIERIFVLLQGKGNSSQQMGEHGRTEVRKCIYLWRKK
jgi:DNA modification methylase